MGGTIHQSVTVHEPYYDDSYYGIYPIVWYAYYSIIIYYGMILYYGYVLYYHTILYYHAILYYVIVLYYHIMLYYGISHHTTLYYRRECTVWPCSIPNLASLNSKQQFNGKKYSARLARVPGITITGTTATATVTTDTTTTATITGTTRASVMGTITTTVADTTETSVTGTTTSLSLWAERFPAPIELDHQTSRSRRNRGHQRGATIVGSVLRRRGAARQHASSRGR
jgi:hypothetical protein